MLPGQPDLHLPERPERRRLAQRRPDPRRCPLEHLRRLLQLRRREARHPGLHDPGLLPRDERQRVPENLHVVIPEGGDAADGGARRRVRGVQAAAEAHLEDRDVDLGEKRAGGVGGRGLGLSTPAATAGGGGDGTRAT